jgi:hypothetical protein
MRYRPTDHRKNMQTTRGSTMAGTPIAEAWATSHQAPLWVAVSLYAAAHADPTTGTVALPPGHLAGALGVAGSTLSQAIRRAVAAGWLDAGSSAYRLIVARPGGGHRA